VADIARVAIRQRRRSLRRTITRFLFYLAVAGIVIWSVGPLTKTSAQPARRSLIR